MKVNISTISIVLLLLIHLHSYAEAKHNCDRLCSWLKWRNYYDIKKIQAAYPYYKSCRDNQGDKEHLSCIIGCDSPYSAKRLECFENCGLDGKNHNCHGKCNFNPETRDDFPNYECIEGCNKKYRDRFKKFYTCLKETPEKKCKMHKKYSTVLPMEHKNCKKDWRECYDHVSALFYYCYRNRNDYEFHKICLSASTNESPSNKDMEIFCDSKPGNSITQKECYKDAHLYRSFALFGCEELFLKTNIERYQNCHQKCR